MHDVFADCWPHGSDGVIPITQTITVNTRFLLLHWARPDEVYPRMDRTFCAFTQIKGNIAFVIEGPKTQFKTRFTYYWQGKQKLWVDGTLDDVRRHINNWVAWVQCQNFDDLIATEGDVDVAGEYGYDPKVEQK